MWEVSDEALLAGYATGDPDAAAVFVRRLQGKVYGLALMITRDSADAEEVAQDALVRAWRYASSYDPRRGSVTGWLLGIARNQALDRVRVSSRRRELTVEEVRDTVIDLSDASDRALGRDDLTRVVASMRQLPPEQQDVIVAVTLLGLSTREISEAWGFPLGTVKSRLRLGLRKLRHQLVVPVE